MPFKKGQIGYWLNKKRSPETIEKMRRGMIGKHWKRKPFTPEHRRKIGEAVKSRIVSDETRRKMSDKRRKEKHPLWGKKHSKTTRLKISLAHKGRPSPRKGTGFLTPRDTLFRLSSEYKIWREVILKRDNYTCRFCLIRGGKLVVDHIKPFALFPELRLSIDNGRTLCVQCHYKTDTYGGRGFYRKSNGI